MALKIQNISFLIILSWVFFNAKSTMGQTPDRFSFEQADSLPKNLLQEKSAVFIWEAPGKREWKKHAKGIHRHFERSAIDVVAYYHLTDVFVNEQVSALFFDELKKRQVKYLIILDMRVQPIALHFMHLPNEAQQIFGSIMAKSLYENSLQGMGELIYQMVYQQDLKRSNYMVINYPQFIELVPYITSKRHEAYNTDVRIDRIAVPQFRQKIGELGTDSLNVRLDTLMNRHYPFEYTLVPEVKEEKALVTSFGTPFILYHMYGQGLSLKKLLGYKVNEEETIYLSRKMGEEKEIKKYNATDEVHKFYIKHVYSGHYYLGHTWDADSNWEQALINFIENMKLEVKVN